jgi:hypothetical protein
MDGVVSSMGKCEKLLNSGVLAMEENGGKFVGQWCFNNGENGERLLNSGVSAMEKEQRVSHQWCFSNGKKGKRIAGRCCFVDGEM